MPSCTVFKDICPRPLHKSASTWHPHTLDYYTCTLYRKVVTHIYVWTVLPYVHALWQNIHPLTFCLCQTHTASEGGTLSHVASCQAKGLEDVAGWCMRAWLAGHTCQQCSIGTAVMLSDSLTATEDVRACVCVFHDRLDESLLCLRCYVPLEDPLVSDWWFWCVCVCL